MGRGVIAAELFRTERHGFEVRTTDPSSYKEGEMWVRSDMAPQSNQIGTLRFAEGQSSVTDIPVMDAAADVVGESKALRLPVNGTTGYIPVRQEGGSYQQLRIQHNGTWWGATGLLSIDVVSRLNGKDATLVVYEDTITTVNTEEFQLSGGEEELEPTELEGDTFHEYRAIINFGGSDVTSAAEVESVTLNWGSNPTWDLASEWDNEADATGAVHESVANTDNDDASVVKHRYSYERHPLNISAVPEIPDSVVTQYQFEDDTDTATATDAAGSNNGAINGGTYDAEARCGSFAYRSDGADDRVVSSATVDLSASGDGSGASVGGFFNPDNATNFQALAYWGPDSNNYLRIDINDNEWNAVTQVNEANFTAASSSGVSTDGYTHVLACHDGNDVYLIIDGTEVARTSTAADVTQIGQGDLVVADGGVNFAAYDGLSDNPSWANKALTESEAQALIDQC